MRFLGLRDLGDLSVAGEADRPPHGEHEAEGRDPAQPLTGLVTEEEQPDDGRGHRLAHHERRGGLRDGSALQGRGVGEHREHTGDGERPGRRAGQQVAQLAADLVQGQGPRQHPGGHRRRTEGEAGDRAERGGPAAPVNRASGNGEHGEGDRSDQDPPLLSPAHVDAAVLGRRQPDEHEPADDHGEPDLVRATQRHVEHDGADDRGDRQEARDDRLHDEQRQRANRRDREHEAETVQADAQQVPPGPGQPQQETGIEALGGLGVASSDCLQHRPDAVAERRTERAEQPDQHSRKVPSHARCTSHAKGEGRRKGQAVQPRAGSDAAH